jgi:acetate CoA/acetoacetate CoA-transferase alpha subunit
MASENSMEGKVISAAAALNARVGPGTTLMVGGFGRGGAPFTLLEYLADHAERFTELTLIKNDASEPHLGLGPLFKAGMVRALISTHIGLNPDVIARMNAKEISVTLIPQGIFAEKIRAKGAGIPAFLTDIGIDTPIAEGREQIVLHNQPYLLEEALGGDVALLCADKVDLLGNCWWRGSNRNMNVVMGMACDKVVVEAFDIVPIGEIPPEDVHLPGIYIDAIVQAAPRRHMAKEGTAS